MAKISANYEVVYIIDPAQGEEAIAATVAKFQSLAEEHGVSVFIINNRELAKVARKMLLALASFVRSNRPDQSPPHG